MKSIIGAFTMTLLLVCLALPNLVFARTAAGDSATGSFKFALDDGEIRFVDFTATEQLDGQVVGDMTFSDPVAIPVSDPDSPDKESAPGVIVRAKVDCLKIVKNMAVICGEIFDSNVPGEIGQRVLLVVEDNGIDGARDRLTWGIVQQPATGWVPTDAERDDDKGASLTWWATDAERRDDVGIPMPPNAVVSCQTFPIATFDFPEIKYGSGDLQVQQR